MAEPAPKRQKGEDEDENGVLNEEDAALAEHGLEEEEANPFVQELEQIQRQLDKVNDEASDRVLAVEQEYNKKRRPIYTQRNEVIAKVPLFWVRVLSSHPIIADHLSDDDNVVLEYMTELDVADFDDIKSGFRIVLTFSESNPCFSNATLTKSFHYGDDGKVTIEPATIDWNEGYAPAADVPTGNKRPGAGMHYMFFDWLASNLPLGEGTPDNLAEALKEEVWPNPLKYYYAMACNDGLDEDDVEGDELAWGVEDPQGGLVEDLDGEGDGGEGEVLYDEGEGEEGPDGGLEGEGEEGGLEGAEGGFGDDGAGGYGAEGEEDA